jgi:hypothetical protein
MHKNERQKIRIWTSEFSCLCLAYRVYFNREERDGRTLRKNDGPITRRSELRFKVEHRKEAMI